MTKSEYPYFNTEAESLIPIAAGTVWNGVGHQPSGLGRCASGGPGANKGKMRAHLELAMVAVEKTSCTGWKSHRESAGL